MDWERVGEREFSAKEGRAKPVGKPWVSKVSLSGSECKKFMESPKTYSEADVMRVLKATSGNNIQVIEQSHVEIPTEIDISGFESAVYPKQSASVIRRVEDAVRACKDFLTGVVVTDTFSDHLQRRDWRAGMNEKYGAVFSKVYGSNKLRLNNLASVHLTLTNLAQGVDLFKINDREKAAAVKEIVGKFPDLAGYDDELSVEEKLAFIARVDDVCKGFLELVSKKE